LCLKPVPPRPIPEATANLIMGLFDDGSVYQFVGDVLFEQFRNEDFADLYPNDGQPALSPMLLSFVTIFQSLEDLSDRKTVYSLRFRFDWKYALHLPPDYRSFDHTVLSEFRQRLMEHKAEGRIFNAIFAQLKQLGFYKQRGIQRTDSLAIYTHCRLLKRIELCVETMRVVIKELLHRDPDWTRTTLPADWEERYARHCKSERLSEEERQTLAVVVGDDGQWLLDRLAQQDAMHLTELRAVETLRMSGRFITNVTPTATCAGRRMVSAAGRMRSRHPTTPTRAGAPNAPAIGSATSCKLPKPMTKTSRT
jgi:transposase